MIAAWTVCAAARQGGGIPSGIYFTRIFGVGIESPTGSPAR